MPATAARPIRYSRTEKLEGKISHLKAQIEDSKQAVRFYRQNPGRRYYPLCAPCGVEDMEIALEAVKKNPGVSFDEALAALRE